MSLLFVEFIGFMAVFMYNFFMKRKSSPLIISYDGWALDAHAMDIRDLAPALLAISTLYSRANTIAYGEKSDVKVMMKATNAGSFEIVNEIVQSSFFNSTVDILTGESGHAIMNLKEIIFGGSGAIGLLVLLKKLKGKSPRSIKNNGDGTSNVTIDGDVHIVNNYSLELYHDRLAREAIEKIIAPLERDGIESFAAKDEKEEIASVSKEESSYFKSPILEEDILLENISTQLFTVSSVDFKRGRKWKLFNGQSDISASICDDDFLDKVDNGLISFSKGDILACKVKTKTYKTYSNLKTTYEILKVIEHRPASSQNELI